MSHRFCTLLVALAPFTYWLQNIPGIIISEKYKLMPSFKLHFLKIVPLCNYTLLPATVEAFETPGSNSVNALSALPSHSESFQYHHKSAFSSMLVSVEGTGKNQLKAGQVSVGDAPLLSHCSLLRNPWPKPTGVLEHFGEGESTFWFSICGAFPSDPIPKTSKDFSIHFFLSFTISLVQKFL